MARYIAGVKFADGEILFAVYDDVSDRVSTKLWASAVLCREAIIGGVELDAPVDNGLSDEEIEVHPYHLYGNPGSFVFKTFANRREMVITGRRYLQTKVPKQDAVSSTYMVLFVFHNQAAVFKMAAQPSRRIQEMATLILRDPVPENTIKDRFALTRPDCHVFASENVVLNFLKNLNRGD